MTQKKDIKKALLSTQRPLVETLRLETDSGPVELVLRRPPARVVADIFSSAEAAGIREGNEANINTVEVLKFNARCVAATVYAPDGVRPLFTEEEVLDWPLAGEVTAACLRALIPPSAAVERAKGN